MLFGLLRLAYMKIDMAKILDKSASADTMLLFCAIYPIYGHQMLQD